MQTIPDSPLEPYPAKELGFLRSGSRVGFRRLQEVNPGGFVLITETLGEFRYPPVLTTETLGEFRYPPGYLALGDKLKTEGFRDCLVGDCPFVNVERVSQRF